MARRVGGDSLGVCRLHLLEGAVFVWPPLVLGLLSIFLLLCLPLLRDRSVIIDSAEDELGEEDNEGFCHACDEKVRIS